MCPNMYYIILHSIIQKSSHAVFYNLVSTCRPVVLKLTNATHPIQFFDDLQSGIKLRTLNITQILFGKHRINMNILCGVKIEAKQSL